MAWAIVRRIRINQMTAKNMAEDRHFYGGQAIMEGVMMRGQNAWGAAVRRQDGIVAVISQPIRNISQRYRWARWPFIRGVVTLVDTLLLGIQSLIFSFNVLVEEQLAASQPTNSASEPAPSKPNKKLRKQSSSWAAWAAFIPSLAIGIGLFILLPAGLVKSLFHNPDDLIKNFVEGIIRLAIIIGYIAAISVLPDIRRIFQYHGAEHAVINCLEDGAPIVPERCMQYSPLHPRCGTAFLLVFIVVKILLGAILPYPPQMWQLFMLRLFMIPFVAAIAYEIIRYGGRHRNSLLARLLAQPGLLLQRLTTRKPTEEQIKIAIYALTTVAPDISLPNDFPPPVPATIDGKLQMTTGISQASDTNANAHTAPKL